MVFRHCPTSEPKICVESVGSGKSKDGSVGRAVQRKGFHVSVGVFVNNVFAPHDENLGRHKLEKRSFLLGGKRAVYEKEGAAVLIGEGRGGERIGESPSVCDDDGVRRPKPAVFPVVVDLHLGLDAVVAAEPHRALDAGMLADLVHDGAIQGCLAADEYDRRGLELCECRLCVRTERV